MKEQKLGTRESSSWFTWNCLLCSMQIRRLILVPVGLGSQRPKFYYLVLPESSRQWAEPSTSRKMDTPYISEVTSSDLESVVP